MERKRAVELLIQEVDKIPHLKTLPHNNDEFRLWLKNVGNIVNEALDPDDRSKYHDASQFLSFIRSPHEEDLKQKDYINEIVRYEIVLKSIIQKYEILGTMGERDKGGEVENKVNKKEVMTFLKDKMGNIIGDLRVLSDKCNRDVDRKYPFNYEYYLEELNRIMVAVEQINPEAVKDMSLLEDAKNKGKTSGSMTGEQDAKLREISAVADKLLSRIHQTPNLEPPKVPSVRTEKNLISESKENWEAIEREFGITKRGFGRRINFVTDPFKRTIIFRDVEQAFALASSGFSKPAVILAGGVIEELLRLYLDFKGFKPIKKDFDGYIQTCEQEDLLKAGIFRLSDSVRHFRNLVHLSKEETKRHTISKSIAKGAVASIFTIANDF